MTGYCKWCDTLTDDIVEDFDSETGMLVWSGCLPCKLKRIKQNRLSKKTVPVLKAKKPTHEELRDRHSERFF